MTILCLDRRLATTRAGTRRIWDRLARPHTRSAAKLIVTRAATLTPGRDTARPHPTRGRKTYCARYNRLSRAKPGVQREHPAGEGTEVLEFRCPAEQGDFANDQSRGQQYGREGNDCQGDHRYSTTGILRCGA